MTLKDKLEETIIEALDGRLRILVQVCNNRGDRHFLARRLAEEIINNQPEWTKEWPTEPGFYWFYGWCNHSLNQPPELHFVSTHKSAIKGQLVSVTKGQFLYKSEGADGYWIPADVPPPPFEPD